MIFYPAIDLKDGRCVRLEKGEMATAVVFNNDPAEQAARFAAAGVDWLHVVDLDGAFAGRPVNAAAVEAILATVRVKVQLGGGIRTMDGIETWLARGLTRVILGTVALREPALVRAACRAFPGQIAVGLDARGGRVALSGWVDQTDVTTIDAARRFADCGVACLIYTDIGRDGVRVGPDIDGTLALAEAVPIPVIASGGIGALEDLIALKASAGARLNGVIVGRALYDGAIAVRDAIRVLAAGTPGGGGMAAC